ncbi:DUF6153 family protein [Streptomyces sp. NPDC053367]|uniref:DUF6153 family protein n=1 Tax=Streptomyces sp. NPDC053367 TaxID=3365700 RepID=UPI0037CED669
MGHLLLVAVLALGVFAMHTMGHPEHSSGTSPDTVTHAVAHHSATAPSQPGSAPSAEQPMAGMDVLSVCLAVLGGGLLWVLLCAAARQKDWLPALLARASAALPPGRPPPEPLLAELSVLRI